MKWIFLSSRFSIGFLIFIIPVMLQLHDRVAAQTIDILNQNYPETIVSGRISRTYFVHLPPSRNEKDPLPVVIALHGGSGSSKGMRELSGWDVLADFVEKIY